MKQIKKIIAVIFFVSATTMLYAQPYFLIVASHKTEAPAQSVAQKHRATGFVNAGYLYAPGLKRYRVYIEKYNSINEARSARNKLLAKYPGVWVLDQSNPPEVEEKTTEASADSTHIAISNLDSGLAATMQQVEDLKQQIALLQDEIGRISQNSEQRDELSREIITGLKDTISILEGKITELKDEIQQDAEEKYVKKGDTVSFAQKAVNAEGFVFGKPKFTLTLGPVQSFVLNDIEPHMSTYFNIDTPVSSKIFYGFQIAGNFYLSETWKTGIDLFIYPSKTRTYLFPYLNIGYSKQLGNVPLRINPFISVGTEVLWADGEDTMAGRYVFYAPGLDLEWGLSKSTSLFANYRHNINTYFDNDVYKLVETQHSSLSFGVRFNIHGNN
ncbi:MAG: SPOR domain-containing protein [Prolixibacteraceae bacterium]|nr:SPOR domain-containing protein [Prolixibacteraceae bacterium]